MDKKLSEIAGVILAGGLSSRMGGGDKSLQLLGKKTILERVIDRLSPQVKRTVLNANGDPERFAKFRIPVISDQTEEFLGPLAGVLSGLDWANENGFEYIITVAADSPFFPLTLVEQLCQSLSKSASPIALAATRDVNSRKVVCHPTFGLWPVSLRNNLRKSLKSGMRKVLFWTEMHKHTEVVFKRGVGDPFFNVNKFEDLDMARNKIKLEE